MPLLDRALGIHQHALPLRNARISTLAANIANADTPGYKAKDVDFGKAIKSQMGQGAIAVHSLLFLKRRLIQVLMEIQLKLGSSKPNSVARRVVMKPL